MRGPETSESDPKAPAAGTAILYLFCSLGFFYSFIATVDPYL